MGDLSPAFRRTKESKSVLLVLAVSQVPLIQNNQYAKVVYFGVTYSEPLHYLLKTYNLLGTASFLEFIQRKL